MSADMDGFFCFCFLLVFGNSTQKKHTNASSDNLPTGVFFHSTVKQRPSDVVLSVAFFDLATSEERKSHLQHHFC